MYSREIRLSRAYTTRAKRIEFLRDSLEPPRSYVFIVFLMIILAFGLGAATFWVQTVYFTRGLAKSSYPVNESTQHVCDPKTAGQENSANPEPEFNLNRRRKIIEKSKGKLRISKELQIVPESYLLTVQLYLPGYGAEIPQEKLLKFDGVVIINMIAVRPSNTIELSSEAITINSGKSYVTQNGRRISVVVVPDEESRKVKLILNQTIEAGKFKLKIVYEGAINSGLSGLYQSKYITNGVEKITAVTQMSPEDARQFVPCFDEPEYKATWKVTVIHPNGTTALANGKEEKSIDFFPGFLSTSFKETPKMSSYLLAIFVSDFKHLEGKFSNGRKTIRMWSRPEVIGDTAFALEAGIKSLDFFEKYYNIEFPLEKQDMVAMPDFRFGAMENWGLVTFRESRMLYNNRTYKMADKRLTALIVAHELAHQWFGNLVTMKWWEDLWLKEGFASCMEFIGTDVTNKDLGTLDYMLKDTVTKALEADSVTSSHPLSSTIDTVEEVMESFDDISYNKGATVVKMIGDVIGEREFSRGIQAYLTKFSYANTEALDLWNTLNKFTNSETIGPDGRKLNITDIALQWTSQMGFPYVTLESNGTGLTVTVKRFKKNEEAREKKKYANPAYRFKWDVPLWYEIEGEGEKFIWVPRGSQAEIPFTNKAILLNSGVKSFIRTNYDQTGWEKIIVALKKNPESFSRRSRYALMSDAFEMASIGRLNYPTLFQLISYAEKEKDSLPMYAILTGLDKLRDFFEGSQEALVLRKFLRKLLQPAYNSILMENFAKNDGIEAKMDAVSQDKLILLKYCGTKDSKCIKKVTDLFEAEVLSKCTKEDDIASKCSQVPASIRMEVYCLGIRHGDEVIFNKMLEMFKRESDPAERISMMTSFTCSSDVPTLRFLLESITDPSPRLFRYQDATQHIYHGVSANQYGRELILNHLISRWEDIHGRFRSTGSFVVSIIKDSTAKIRSEKELQQLKDFVNSTPEAAKYNEFSKGIENAENRLNWIKNNRKEVTEIMNKLI